MNYLRSLKNRVSIVAASVFLTVCVITIFVLLLQNMAKTKPETVDSKNDSIYSEYLHKVWVVTDWEGKEYSDKVSLCITEIEDDIITGIFATGTIAFPACYIYSLYSLENIGDFSGEIRDGIANCKFYDAEGNAGRFVIDR